MDRMQISEPIEIAQMAYHAADLLPSELHRSMFVPTLLSQASDEQQSQWLRPAQQFQLLGTYVQTELGHGSFVRGIETTATFDPSTDEFVCHTPTLTATKWWPGNLAHAATHCIQTTEGVASRQSTRG
jgi:acyl-CoA oxidase